MRKTPATGSRLTPSLRAVPFLADSEMIVLSVQQREQLEQIATRLRLPARKIIYKEDSEASWVFAVAEGAVKSYRELPSGRRALSAFLFARDLFGLAEKGRYVNTTQAIVPVTLFRFSLSQLTHLLKCDADLQFKFLAKVTHELRESQRRAILINRRDAVGRLAMFLEMMAARSERSGHDDSVIPIPMTRSDIAAYLGLSLETVSRAAAELQEQELVKFENRHIARILDPTRFAALVAAV